MTAVTHALRALRAAWRLLHALMHALRGLAIIVFEFPSLDAAGRASEVQRWAARMLVVLGIELQLAGRPPATGPVLLVANHLSWLDIVVLHAARHCRFVSKDDVAAWPLIGRLATGAGTLYIDRSSRRAAARMVSVMADSLRQGDVVAVFAEGTTGDGRALLPFHSNLLQSAILAAVPVQAIGLCFIDPASGEPTFAPSYIDDETLLGSVWRTLCAAPIVARVNCGEPESAAGGERRALAARLHAEVDRLRRHRPPHSGIKESRTG